MHDPATSPASTTSTSRDPELDAVVTHPDADPSAAVDDDKRECRTCYKTKPLTEFRLHKGRHRWQCRDCHRETERVRYRAKREGLAGSEFRRQLTKFNEARTVDAAKTVFDRMLSGFGGAEGLSRQWFAFHEKECKRSTNAKLRSFALAAKLAEFIAQCNLRVREQMIACRQLELEESRDYAKAVAGMDLDEIDEAITDLIFSRPDVAKKVIAKRLAQTENDDSKD